MGADRFQDAKMLRNLYDRVIALSASRHAPWWLAVISFAEASFFPIPPDVLLIPMVLARREKALWFALVCTVASVAGGALGYLIGYWLFDVIAAPLIHLYGYDAAYTRFKDTFAEYGLWIIIGKGFLPVPYKIVTIAAGAASYNFASFMAASALTRGGRFFAVAIAFYFFGPSARAFIEKRLGLVLFGVLAGIIFGFALLRFL